MNKRRPRGKPALDQTPGRDLWTLREKRPHCSRFVGRTCDPVEDPHWSSLFLKEGIPWKGTHSVSWAGRKTPLPEEEVMAETMIN